MLACRNTVICRGWVAVLGRKEGRMRKIGKGGKAYPGGSECRYMHLSPPFGHDQNQPYFPISTASMKNLHTLSVVVFGFPCLLITTSRSFSSSHPAISSFRFSSSSSSSLVSVYRFRFSLFRPTSRSWLNLHFLPFSQLPCL